MQDFMQPTSRVYALTDEDGRIVRLEGEYSLPDDLTDWVKIDEGNGDKYSLAQSHYLPHPLLTHDGLYRYRLVDGEVVERSEAELEAERAALPRPEVQPTAQELMDAILELSQAIGG